MRATNVLLASGMAIFAIFFFDALVHRDAGVDVSGRTALGAFEFFGAAASLYLVSKGRSGKASIPDWVAGIAAILVASLGYIGFSISLFALYLFTRDRDDLNSRAAGTRCCRRRGPGSLGTANFFKDLFPAVANRRRCRRLVNKPLFAGGVVERTVPTPSGHDVAITAPCASFHNLSLASLCWVTLTMLHRPYWLKSDIYVGLVAALVQFGFNIWRLVFVCLSLPMYQFWHDGLGKHIFSGVATLCAILFVEIALIRRDRRAHYKADLRIAGIS